MKNQSNNTVIKLSERFDQQLLDILSKDLSALKSVKNNEIKAMLPKQKDRLMVA